MEIILIIIIGFLTAGGIYLLLQRRLLRLIIGLNLISQAANLVIFTAGKTHSYQAPIIGNDQSQLLGVTADPVPQALILTAIVIGFALIAFFVVITKRVYSVYATDNIDALKGSDLC